MAYHAIVEKQRELFKTGATASVAARKDKLTKLRKLISENTDELCAAVEADLRRNPKATVSLEVSNAIVEIDYMLSNLDEWTKPVKVERTLLTLLDSPFIVKDPLGVVLIISPWNYPVAMTLLPLVPALAAGNTVILKPSEVSEHSAKLFGQLFPKYFPEEEIAVVNGGIPETTDLLKERFDHILYTGCTPVGKIVMAAAARHLTPVTLELGGKCPVVVEDDADLEISARRIAWGKWLNVGQTCLAPDYVMVSAKSKPALLAAFRKAIEEFYGSDVKASPDYARIISERHFDRVVGTLAKSKGVQVTDYGQPDRADKFIAPTIVDCERDDVLLLDEIFGPVLPVITVSGLNDAIDVIKKGEKPLAAYIFTRNEGKVKKFLSETSSGAVTVNDVIMHLTVDTLPFGGVGYSGMGRYRGKFGFDTFTHEKAVLKRGFFGESLLAIRYPPTTAAKVREMARLTGRRVALPRFLAAWLPSVPLIVLSIVAGILLQVFLLEPQRR